MLRVIAGLRALRSSQDSRRATALRPPGWTGKGKKLARSAPCPDPDRTPSTEDLAGRDHAEIPPVERVPHTLIEEENLTRRERQTAPICFSIGTPTGR
jgi:hypothetical protein